MKIYVDIDDTICYYSKDEPVGCSRNYANAIPHHHKIKVINSLFDSGHSIHYWTARGTQSGIDWLPETLRQLKEWGCKYTSANVGKPSYDILIDDKAWTSVEQIETMMRMGFLNKAKN